MNAVHSILKTQNTFKIHHNQIIIIIVLIIVISFDYFSFFYVKHFELPLCMKCAINKLALPIFHVIQTQFCTLFYILVLNFIFYICMYCDVLCGVYLMYVILFVYSRCKLAIS